MCTINLHGASGCGGALELPNIGASLALAFGTVEVGSYLDKPAPSLSASCESETP